MNLQNFVRPNIWRLKPYSSARHEFEGEADVYLDANENPYGAPYSRYPDPLQWELKEKIAEYKGIGSEQIFLGNGSDEAIDLLIRIFCNPGLDEIIIVPPTYGMYKVCADISDVRVRECWLTPDFQLDLPAIINSSTPNTKLLFICSPNNPTGNLIHAELVGEVLKVFPGIVILDEAYIDFAEEATWLPRLNEYPNLVILQTFSKAWGLAGIRLGLAFASIDIIHLMNKVKPPYNINKLTQEHAFHALQEGAGNKGQEIFEILSERARMTSLLAQSPKVLQVYKSSANFLLVKFQDPQGAYTHLKAKGIVVRDRSNTPLCDGSLRITIGTPKENDMVIDALNQL